MNLEFDLSLSDDYKSSAQKIRVMSESWLGNNMYCPNCGNPKISHLTNNSPVADFQCDNCGEIYELKSKSGYIGKKIADGAYSTMIDRITSDLLHHRRCVVTVDRRLICPWVFHGAIKLE